jgi:lycopene cyclase domain-containing protein
VAYWLLLILFICLPIAGLIFVLRRHLWGGFFVRAGVTAGFTLCYIAPWYIYVVAARIVYYDPALMLGISFAYVPLEKFLFFPLQALLIGLFVLWLWRRFYPDDFKG